MAPFPPERTDLGMPNWDKTENPRGGTPLFGPGLPQ
jgi:hypothetical protein